MRRVGKGFSGVDTPLFDGMLVTQQVQDDVADAAKDEDAANEISAKLTPPSPTPATTPPPQQELIPSPLQTYVTLTKQVANLEQDKIAQAIEITKLKQRVKHLEKKRQRMHPNRGGLTELNADEDVTLKEVAAKEIKDADVQGRLLESQAHVYHLDLEHAQKVLSMQETNEAEPAKMDFFKGMTYTDIRPIFEKHFNSIWAFLEKGEKEIEEEDGKRKSENLEHKATKKQNIDEEVEELKTHLQIVPNDEDDVYTKATTLALKYVKDNVVQGNKVVNKSLTAELVRYKEQVELYEKRARLKENVQRNYCCWFNITAAGSILVLLDKVSAAAEVLKNLL
nr:hypothetical protein [Tanacetum cinerariifolium]